MQDKGDNFLVDKIDDKGYDYEIINDQCCLNQQDMVNGKFEKIDVTSKGIVSCRWLLRRSGLVIGWFLGRFANW